MLKELFSKHGIPETLRSDNGPQFANHMFAKFAKEWNSDHNTSSPRNPRSNGQAEATMKIVKGLLSKAKYSGQDPHLALLAYGSTPIDAYLQSPAEVLYQRSILTTLPQRICHKDPHAADDHDRLNQCATQSAEYHNCHCRTKFPLYAGQTVSVLNNDKSLWLPAKVIHKANHGLYLVQVIGGGQYRSAHDHIRECHPDAVKAGTSTTADVAPATPESLLRHHQQSHQQHLLHLLHQQHHSKLLLQQLQTLHANHHLPCAHHSDSRWLPMEVHQSRLVQHLLPLANQLMSVSQPQGLLRRCDPDRLLMLYQMK